MTDSKGIRLAVIIMIVAGAVVPICHYWFSIGRVPGVTPQEAWNLLQAQGHKTLLVDVRTPESFKSTHIKCAQNWPYEEIVQVKSLAKVPEQFKGKTLLLLCDSGIRSAFAAWKLRSNFALDAYNIRDGMQGWTAFAGWHPAPDLQLVSSSGETVAYPYKDSPLLEQWVLVISGFVIKPIYMLLSFLLIIILLRLKSPDAVALRWGQVSFLVGEWFCALNYLLYGGAAHLFEFFHSYGMVLSFGFGTYAILEFIDLRIVNYGDPDKRCAALSLCRQCAKHSDVRCGLKLMFYFLIPAHIILAFMLLLADTYPVSYNSKILGVAYNYSHSVFYQIFETRYCPIFAIILLAASYAVLLFKKKDAVAVSKVFFAAGMGPLGFGLLRLIFFGLYRDNLVWFNFWEEITELMYVAGIGVVLWLFRRGLFREKNITDATVQSAETV
jgi:rhodanese-related sulfurtransferase